MGLPVCGALAVVGVREFKLQDEPLTQEHPIVPVAVAILGTACFANNLYEGPTDLSKAKALEAEAAALDGAP